MFFSVVCATLLIYSVIICISSDHAGYDLKKLVADHLTELGHEVILAGATSGDVPFSYVEAGQACAEDVSSTGGVIIFVIIKDTNIAFTNHRLIAFDITCSAGTTNTFWADAFFVALD